MQDTALKRYASSHGSPDAGLPWDHGYIGPRQLAYFRQKLLVWRATLLADTQETRAQLRDGSHHEAI